MENESTARKDRNDQDAQTVCDMSVCDKCYYRKSNRCLTCDVFAEQHPKLVCNKCYYPWGSCICESKNLDGHPVKIGDELRGIIRTLHEKGYEIADCSEGRGRKWKNQFHIAFGHRLPQTAISSLPEGFVYAPEGFVPAASRNTSKDLTEAKKAARETLREEARLKKASEEYSDMGVTFTLELERTRPTVRGEATIKAVPRMELDSDQASRAATQEEYMADLLAWAEGLPAVEPLAPEEKPRASADGRPEQSRVEYVFEHGDEMPPIDGRSFLVGLKTDLPRAWGSLLRLAGPRRSDSTLFEIVLSGLAANPKTPPAALGRLALHTVCLSNLEVYGRKWPIYRPFLESLASNPSTPAWALDMLGDYNSFLAAPFLEPALLANPSLPKSTLKYLIRVLCAPDPSSDRVLWNPSGYEPAFSPALDEETVREMVGEGYILVAGGDSTPADVADMLARSGDYRSMVVAATCRNCSPETLEYMLEVCDDYLFEGILQHPNLSRKALDRAFEKGWEDSSFLYMRLAMLPDATRQDVDTFLEMARVKGGLGRNAHGAWDPQASMNSFFDSSPSSGTLNTLDRQLWLSKCTFVAGEAHDEHLLEALAEDGDRDTRTAVASNPAAPSWLLERMAASGDAYVRLAVAGNPEAPATALETLSRDPRLATTVASNPASPSWLLERLAASGASEVRDAVAGNPKAPAATLRELSHDPGLAATLAANPSAPWRPSQTSPAATTRRYWRRSPPTPPARGVPHPGRQPLARGAVHSVRQSEVARRSPAALHSREDTKGASAKMSGMTVVGRPLQPVARRGRPSHGWFDARIGKGHVAV